MQGDMFTTGALIALMVLSFYFLILRPGRKRQREQAKTMQSLVPGARVLLASGVYGTLVSKSDQEAVVEIAPGVRVEVVSRAIVQVVSSQNAPAEPAPEVEPGEARDPEPPAGGTEQPQR